MNSYSATYQRSKRPFYGIPCSHRYGFQGQEMDDEVKGNGNSVNFEFRMHDPRLGRFFAIDPLTAKYPYYSPYAFSGNRVIDANELEGLEPVVHDQAYQASKTVPATQVVGYMTIVSGDKAGSSSLSIGAGVHAWIRYEGLAGGIHDGVNYTTGTWGNQTTGEFLFNMESGRLETTSRTLAITAEQFQFFYEFTQEAENVDWTLVENCSNYAVSVWNFTTGENLSATNLLGIPTPLQLAYNIQKSNGGQDHSSPIYLTQEQADFINKAIFALTQETVNYTEGTYYSTTQPENNATSAESQTNISSSASSSGSSAVSTGDSSSSATSGLSSNGVEVENNNP